MEVQEIRIVRRDGSTFDARVDYGSGDVRAVGQADFSETLATTAAVLFNGILPPYLLPLHEYVAQARRCGQQPIFTE